MTERPKVPNLVLRRIRVEERQETRAEFAQSMARKAHELGELITPSERYIARLEDGDIRYPHPPYRRVLAELCGRSITDLGFPAPANTGRKVDRMALTVPRVALPLIEVRGEISELREPHVYDEYVSAQAWPAWFGVKLARITSVVDNWMGSIPRIDSLQALLHEEIVMFDAAAPDHREPDYLTHALARRQVLITLAALPGAIVASNRIESAGARSPAAAQEFFLSRCAASITACWHLLRGSDLQTVGDMISSYLLPLEAIAYESPKHQSAAATLASQAHRIAGILALHQDQLKVREYHCKRALHHATVASDVGSNASALISLASTYFYMSEPDRAAGIYERAFALETRMPALQRSRVYAELSVVYGQIGREQDAIRSAEQAEEFYPDHPEHDPSFLYAEFTPSSLTLEKGLAYVALAERFDARSYEDKAAEIFSRLNAGELGYVPDRIRFEIVNNQARTAVLLGDMDAFEAYFHAGIEGATLLGSRQRRHEIDRAWANAAEKWPAERRIDALSERLQLTQGDGQGSATYGA
jgi:tetratricopeptide (TPR) repeat protein